MITVEQIVNTQKSNIDTFFGLSGKAFEGVEKLIELNISAAKTAMAEAAQNTKLALSAKDPQELVALQTSLFQPAARRLPPTAATCTRSPPPRAPRSRASPRRKLPKRKPGSWRSSTRPSRTRRPAPRTASP